MSKIRGHSLSILVSILVTLFTLVLSELKLNTISKRSAPEYKSWWAKEITPDIYVAGRLSEREIKYAAEAGFKSILSLFPYADDEGYNFGGEYLPTTKEAKQIAELAGLKYTTALGPYDDWAQFESVQKVGSILSNLPRPVLAHCDRGYTISFDVIMYLVNRTIQDSKFTPKVDAKKFFDMTKVLGMDFNMDCVKDTLATITGEKVKNEYVPEIENEPEEWYDYWHAAPVYKNWYTAGQILTSHLSMIKQTGFKSVVNLRTSIETVTLLNVKDIPCKPVKNSDLELRQTINSLKENVLDKNKPNTYISPESPYNFATRNPAEFGDDTGYNENLEKEAFQKLNFPYYHMPLDTNIPFTVEWFEMYKDQLLEAGKKGPVLVHCCKALRAGYVAVLAAALQHNKDLNWALQRVAELGLEVGPNNRKDVYYTYKAVLDPENINVTGREDL
ncbi:uncharacterized protein LOC134279340 [Saccostrea cucullata]|uniref:uncharacterized protein LOC134279340 n=1 Tax=Saccostrea cuccullata TaxID=36930 RepID=UPI002ED4BD95